MKINEFVKLVSQSRKRTGIALLNSERSDFISDFAEAGVKIIDLSSNFSGQVILADNAFLQLIVDCAIGVPTCYTNIELYVGPRFEDSHYLKYVMPKLLNREPLNPIFFVFYSKLLYEKFKSYYMNYPYTRDHFFEEDM